MITSADMLATLGIAVLALAPCLAQAPAPAQLTLEEKERFLLEAPVVNTREAKKGITGTTRATLSNGAITHDASIQKIDEERLKFETPNGVEYNFRDTYKFNIAAYRLGRMLGLESMIPVSVDRSIGGSHSAVTWWIENVQMDEVERLKKHMESPDKDGWSRQYLIMKAFDALIFNTDRNAQNMLYDKDWRLWMIDHSRAFRLHERLPDPKVLTKCDRVLLDRMKRLTEAKLKEELGEWLRPREIRAILARRDLLVQRFDGQEDRLYTFLPADTVAQVK